MGLRLTTVNELQFLRCLQHGVWGSSRQFKPKRWQEGDLLALLVEKQIAALAELTGKPFHSEKEIWDNGLFPERIRLKFVHAMDISHRVPIQGPIRDVLTASWGRTYGWGILNKQVLPTEAADKIVRAILAKPNDLEVLIKQLPSRIEKAKSE